jgi:hypothetical protein
MLAAPRQLADPEDSLQRLAEMAGERRFGGIGIAAQHGFEYFEVLVERGNRQRLGDQAIETDKQEIFVQAARRSLDERIAKRGDKSLVQLFFQSGELCLLGTAKIAPFEVFQQQTMLFRQLLYVDGIAAFRQRSRACAFDQRTELIG